MPEKVLWRPQSLHFSSAWKTLAIIIIIIFKNMYFLRNECYYLSSIICKKLELLKFKLAIINNFRFLTVQYTKPENLVQIPRIHGLHKPKIKVVKHIKMKTRNHQTEVMVRFNDFTLKECLNYCSLLSIHLAIIWKNKKVINPLSASLALI